MLAENPPPAHHAVVLGQFARIGIGPGLDVDAQPDVVKQGLTRTAMTGMAMLRQQFLSGDWATLVNGWRYPPPDMGHFGDDFLQRAAGQSMAGITANDPAESVYLVNFTDADGSTLTPGGRYELHFTAGSLPPVDAFWSLAAYTTQDMNLIPNAADRYSVGDRTPACSGTTTADSRSACSPNHQARTGSRTGCPPRRQTRGSRSCGCTGRTPKSSPPHGNAQESPRRGDQETGRGTQFSSSGPKAASSRTARTHDRRTR